MNLCYAYGAKPPTQHGELVERDIVRGHRYHNTLIDLEQRHRLLKEALSKREAPLVHQDYLREQQEEYDRSGMYWPNRLLIRADAQAAARTANPRFHGYRGDGRVGVELVGGLPVPELLRGEDTRVRIVGTGKRRELFLRIGSDDSRNPIWAIFPFVYHRDLPEEATVKWVRAHRRRVGTTFDWSVQFVLDTPEHPNPLPAPTKGVIGIDYGWRRLPNERMRVAVWRDDQGEGGELFFPDMELHNGQPGLVPRWEKAESLRSIRARLFNEKKELLVANRRSSWPTWLLEEVQTIEQWHSESRLAGLVQRWRHKRFNGDRTVFSQLATWYEKERHLYDWQTHQQAKVLRTRLDRYRNFAVLAATYKEIRIKRADFRELAAKPEGKDDYALRGARRYQFKAAPGELFSCIREAAARSGSKLLEVNPAHTTLTCHLCGFRNKKFPNPRALYQVCANPKCGEAWDQDVNAAMNLCRGGIRT